jgi:hypothetical protein
VLIKIFSIFSQTSFNMMPPLSEPTFDLLQTPASSHSRRQRAYKRLSPITKVSLSVTFDEEAEVRYVEHILELSPEVIENTWYNAGQFQRIKKINIFLSKMLRRGDCEETDDYSFRGLEHRTKEGSLAREDAKEKASDLLFLEQRRQKVEGIEDPEYLAELMNECTAERRQIALQFAKADQEAVIDGNSSFTEETDSQDTPSVSSSQAMSLASAPVEEESSSSITFEAELPLESDEGSMDISSHSGRRRPTLRRNTSSGGSLLRTLSPHGLRNFLRRPKRDPVTGKRQLNA